MSEAAQRWLYDRPKWYAHGLRFECTRCGHCCTGSPGFVWLSPREESEIAEQLEITPQSFRRRYTRLMGKLISLVEKPGTTGDCVFLTEERTCGIQPVKPRQCLTFPFWGKIVASREKWEHAARECPGIGQGPLYKPEEIDAIVDRETPRELICSLMPKGRA